MVIDFSKSTEYWIDLFKRLLTAFSSFMYDCFGIEIFAPSGTDDKATATDGE